jgi:hypothetical protein
MTDANVRAVMKRSILVGIASVLSITHAACSPVDGRDRDADATNAADATASADVSDGSALDAEAPRDAAALEDRRAVDDAGNCPADLTACEYPGAALPVACVGCTSAVPITITDPMTGRVIPLAVRYPMRAGSFPVVIWSHGGGLLANAHTNNEQWGDAIASAGYIVIHLSHVPFNESTAVATCALASIPPAACMQGTDPNDSEAPLVTIVRPRDVIAVMDQLTALATRLARPGGPTIDDTRVVVAGWSAGSRAPSMLFGATRRLTPTITRFTMADRRPIASVMISPAGPGFFGFFNDGPMDNSFRAMRGPVLVMTGDNDVKADNPTLTGAIRRGAFDLQPAEPSRGLLFSRLPRGVGGHETFNLEQLGDADPRLDRLSRALRSTMLAFLDATVRREPAAIAWLATDRPRLIAGDAEWTRR